ncbi:hypothetical protein [Bradyrhizobium sp. WSM2793]|uniref:hypothetical protein n=1 Tax=Bradyrhizobium sp. WSM2793 TaxID=1038866 RepID=UPI0003661E72|nr:hypothetical protein [Bradyrhizobium sp. WSM2793]
MIEVIGYCCAREITLPGTLQGESTTDEIRAKRIFRPPEKEPKTTIWLTEGASADARLQFALRGQSLHLSVRQVSLLMSIIKIAVMDQGD